MASFKPGDRVAAFHEMLTPHGSFSSCAVAPASTTFHLSPNISFEEGATIPLAAMTAALGLYQRLELPLPWLPVQSRTPLVIYGAASAVGAFAVKLARLSGIHPLICVAGRGKSFVETLIEREKGDTVVDYRDGDEAVVAGLKNALGKGEKLKYAFDAVSDKGSYQNLGKVMDEEEGRITFVLPRKKYDGVADGVQKSFTQVGKVHSDRFPGLKGEKSREGLLGDQEFGEVMYGFLGRGLAKGWFKGHPFEVVQGGLEGIEGALRNLKEGKASAVKYVFRIEENEGVPRANI